MKLLTTLLLLTLLVAEDSVVISWQTDTVHEFGDLLQDEPATVVFKFKNISGQPVVIESVRPTCGCTAPDWDFTPIPPDSTGQLAITFDAKKTGFFSKKVKVFFSGQRKAERLYIEGFVE